MEQKPCSSNMKCILCDDFNASKRIHIEGEECYLPIVPSYKNKVKKLKICRFVYTGENFKLCIQNDRVWYSTEGNTGKWYICWGNLTWGNVWILKPIFEN